MVRFTHPIPGDSAQVSMPLTDPSSSSTYLSELYPPPTVTKPADHATPYRIPRCFDGLPSVVFLGHCLHRPVQTAPYRLRFGALFLRQFHHPSLTQDSLIIDLLLTIASFRETALRCRPSFRDLNTKGNDYRDLPDCPDSSYPSLRPSHRSVANLARRSFVHLQ